MPPTSLATALEDARRALALAGVAEPLLEARMLVEHVLGQSRSWVLAHPECPMDAPARDTLASLVKRRSRGEPVAYLQSAREFYGVSFYVDSRVLIPRPETERLVDRVVAIAEAAERALRIVDVGTGSGAIAVTLAKLLPEAQITAVDRSREALSVASRNAHALGVAARLQFVQGDVLTWLGGSVDIVVANLPYIPSEVMDALPRDVREFEPSLALDGGRLGIEINARLIAQASLHLPEGGTLLLECEPDQIAPLVAIASAKLPGCRVNVLEDGYGHQRFLEVHR